MKVRVNRAAGLAALAAAALLVGPHSTFGLDTGAVTGTVNQVSSTTQAVVETTQQTVQTTVTTVETTTQAVQQTVETTVQQAPVPVSTAAPVSAAPAPSAPQQTSSPARRQTTTTADAPVRRVTDKVRQVERSAASKLTAVQDGAKRATERGAAVTRAAGEAAEGTGKRSRTTRSAAAAERSGALASCLPIQVPRVLVALDLAPLVSVLCTGIELPARGGPATTYPGVDTAGVGTSPIRTIARVLGVVASVAAPLNPFAALLPGDIRLHGERASREATTAANTSVAGVSANGGSVASGASGAQAAGPAGVLAQPDARASAATNDVRGQGHSEGGVLDAVNATNALIMILIIDAALLAGICMWRGARRWVLPRLA